MEPINTHLSEVANRFSDRRVQLFDVKASSLAGKRLLLQGRVLDQTTLQALQHSFEERLPELVVDYSQIRILRPMDPCLLQVATNLTSVHAEPSWLAEMLSQCTFGTSLEILAEQDGWVFVRQVDGYLGWMYRPYLTDHPTPAPTYIVASPLTEIHAESDPKSPLRSRLVGGTLVQVVSTRSAWAEIDANTWGWAQLTDLRALDNLPTSLDMRRKAIVND